MAEVQVIYAFPLDVMFDITADVDSGYLYRVGDDLSMRSIHPDTVMHPRSGVLPYHRFVATGRSLDEAAPEYGWHIFQGVIAPWFGQPGGGTMWLVRDREKNIVAIRELIRAGVLREVFEIEGDS